MYDGVNARLRRKFIALQAYIRKERLKINNSNIQLKGLEKGISTQRNKNQSKLNPKKVEW